MCMGRFGASPTSILFYAITLQKFYTPFYSNTMKHNRYLHILWFLHFSDNTKKSHITGNNYETMKAKDIFCDAE
jgi:hypothetical protein